MMVDVASIFEEVFGPDDQDQTSSKNKRVQRVSVSGPGKPLENLDIPDTFSADTRHENTKSKSGENGKCVREIEENQEVIDHRHENTKTHLKTKPPSKPVDGGAFEERAAIIHEAHTRTIADDGTPLPEPIFALTHGQAETLAAQEQGHADADSLHRDVVGRWAAEIERLATLPAVSPDGAEALKRAKAFIAEGWALQAVRLGWDEVEIFGICPRAPWVRQDRKGVAFGGAVQAVTAAAVVYIGGLRRYRAQVNNEGCAVPIWELEGDPGEA